MICKKCNNEVKEGAKFCIFCGAPAEEPEESGGNNTDGNETAAGVYGNMESPGPDRARRWSPAVIGVTAAVVAAVVVASVYIGVISIKNYKTMSFDLGEYEVHTEVTPETAY